MAINYATTAATLAVSGLPANARAPRIAGAADVGTPTPAARPAVALPAQSVRVYRDALKARPSELLRHLAPLLRVFLLGDGSRRRAAASKGAQPLLRRCS